MAPVASPIPIEDRQLFEKLIRLVQALKLQKAHASVTIIIQGGQPMRVRLEQSFLPADLPDIK